MEIGVEPPNDLAVEFASSFACDPFVEVVGEPSNDVAVEVTAEVMLPEVTAEAPPDELVEVEVWDAAEPADVAVVAPESTGTTIADAGVPVDVNPFIQTPQ